MFKFNYLDNEDDSSYNPPKVAFNFQHYTKKKNLKKKRNCASFPIMPYSYTCSLTSQQQSLEQVFHDHAQGSG